MTRKHKNGTCIALLFFLTLSNLVALENWGTLLPRDFYPYRSIIFYFNKNIRSVEVINDGRFGKHEDIYQFSLSGDTLSVLMNSNLKYVIEFQDARIVAEIFDVEGLLSHRFDLQLDEQDRIVEYDHTWRFRNEGESTMFTDIDYFEYEDNKLRRHRRPSQYRYREFTYNEDDQLVMVENFLGNGEEVTHRTDRYVYQDEHNYTAESCSELSFESIHYPHVERKEHREEIVNGIRKISDTYYYKGEVYYKYESEWKGDRILKLMRYRNYINHKTTYIFNYR